MGLEVEVILKRMKRCVEANKIRASEKQYHTVKQQMEELAALIDILEHKLAEDS